MRLIVVSAVTLFILGGCSRLAGLEREYVLREPVTVALDGADAAVTIPAGALIKQTSLKDDTAFVVLRGRTNRHKLQSVGGPE